MNRTLHERCRERFRRLHRAAAGRLLMHGLAAWLAVSGLVVLLSVLVLGFLAPPRWIRLPLVIAGWLVIVLAAVEFLWRSWRNLRTSGALARDLDRAGRYDNTLAAAEEVLQRPDRWRRDTPVRKLLVERLLARAERLLDALPLPRLLPVWRPALVFPLLFAVLVGGAWLQRAAPERLWRGVAALSAPWRADPAADAASLRLVPAPDHVAAGESVLVAVLDLAGGAEPVYCEVRSGSGYWQPLPTAPVFLPGADPVLGAPYERWEAVLADVREDLSYRFRRGVRLSETGLLAIWHPPLLLNLAARVAPPAYTGLPELDWPRLPAQFEVPQGSRLVLSGRANQPLAAAGLITAAGDTIALATEDDALGGALEVAEPLQFWTALTDDRGQHGRSELVYTVDVVPDRLPVALLQRPGDDGRLPLNSPLVLFAGADDDYGLQRVDLLLRRAAPQDRGGGGAEQSGGANVPDVWDRIALLDAGAAPLAGQRAPTTGLGPLPLVTVPRPAVEASVRVNIELQAGGLRLVPGDVLELAVEAQDNRRPGPPGVGRSAVLRLVVPSNLDLVEAGAESQAVHRDDLAAMRDRSESLSAELERLRRELLKNPVPGWDRRQMLQAAIQRQQELQAELARLADAMSRDLESLVADRLASPELLEQMDLLAELLAESRAEGMQDLLDRMREALEQMSPADLTRAMDDLTRNQQDMLRRLDTALDMVKDLARRQEMEGLTELAAELIRKQQELATAQRQRDEGKEAGAEQRSGDTEAPSEDAETPGESPPPSPEDLARRQEALAKELEALAERLQEALAELSESESQPDSAAEQAMRDALAEALKQLEERQTSETMRQAGENLQRQDSQQAQADMEQALADLAGLYHVLLRSQAAMQMAMRMEQAGQMRNLAADLLAISERQEQLSLDLPASLRDVRSDELVRRQHMIVQGAIAMREGLQEVAAAAPREVMRMLEKIDELIRSSGHALNQLQDGRAMAARQAAQANLAAFNELVISLLTQAQTTGQGGGSGSPQQMLSQQLQQMAQEQSGLNALAEQLSRQQNRLSEQLRAGMQRLQEGQRGLSGRARELAEDERREPPDGGRVLGDLDQLARDMERVGDDLAGGLITDEVLRRQERILSRLLDMHNASRERDWSRRRESRSEVDVLARQEGDLGRDAGETTPQARRWQAVEEAPPAYRELVREYFREIQRLHELSGRDLDGQRSHRQGLP